MRSVLFATALAVAAWAPGANALWRENVTSAFMMLSLDCETCTAHDDSAFCKEAGSGYLKNASMEDKLTGSSSFCWAGTFGKMLELDGVNMTAYLTEKADWHLECAAKGIYYNQCLLSAETALILMIVGGILVVGGVTFMFFCCGWCKCCNAEGDDSNWGCCNRIKKSCKKQSAEEIQMMNNPGFRREKEKAEQEKSGLF